MIKTVIFDFDDTLYEVNNFLNCKFKKISKYFSKRYNLNENKVFNRMKTINEKRGPEYKKLFNETMLKFNIKLKKNELNEVLNIIHSDDECITKVKMKKADLKFLKYLKSNKIRIIILTKGSRKKQISRINKLKLNTLADKIIYVEDAGYSKSNLVFFKNLIKKYKINVNECLIVGDNPISDLVCAKILGIKTIRILRGYNKKYKKTILEDYQIKKLNEIKEILINH